MFGRRNRELEQEVADLRRRLDHMEARPALYQHGQQVRLAKTVPHPETEVYPGGDADTFHVAFLDATFTETQGQQDVSETDRGTTALVHSLQGFIPQGTLILMTEQNGRWWTYNLGMVRCCYAEQHPGYNIVFEVYPGRWNPATDNWDYSTEKVKAKDLFYAEPEIVPGEGATGMFIPRPSDEYGVIYMAVSGDCDSPGSCYGYGYDYGYDYGYYGS